MDEELSHIIGEIGIGGSSRRTLISKDIRTLAKLIESKEQLQDTCIDLKTADRTKLIAVIKWRALNPNVDILQDFEECSIEDFLAVAQDLAPTTDEQWHHICVVVGIPQGSRNKLEVKEGVRTLENLMEFQQTLENAKPDFNVWEEDQWKEVKEKLLAVIKWRLMNRNANVLEDFNSDAYEEIFKHQRIALSYIELALGKPFQNEHKHLYDVIQEENILQDVIKYCQQTVMSSSYLRLQCGNFNYESFIEKSVMHFHSLNQHSSIDGIESKEKIIVVAGRTQSGKSAIKGVIQSFAGMIKLPLIVLTKGVDESIDLHAKLVKLSHGTMMQGKHVVVASGKGDGLGYRVKKEKISEAFEGVTHGGTLVIADTQAQVLNKACKAIKEYRNTVPNGKFILVVDEADAMFRSQDGHQIFEKALQQLLNLQPCMTVMISATPVTYMLKLVSSGRPEDSIYFFNLEPCGNYVGTDDLQPLKIHGDPVFLEQDELTKTTDIPYLNEKVIALYEDAISQPDNCKGVLLLDCTTPFVTAPGNVRVKAVAVQEELCKKGIDITVITFTGSGVSIKLPREPWDDETYRKSLIGDLLDILDRKYGLETPVFIFGHSKMRRGISFRGSKRVPTHMIMAMGKGHNSSTIVQTAGRATFKGRDLLNENGFRHVTVLMTRNDYTIIKKYQKYIDHVNRRIQFGDSFAAAVTGANELIPDSANFLRETFRELGSIKGDRQRYFSMVQHEEPKGLSTTELETKKKFWMDTNAQKLLRSILRLQKSNPLFTVDDAKDDLEEAEDHELSKTAIKKLLQLFQRRALIENDPNDKNWYQVAKINKRRLSLFLNPQFGTHDEDDDASESGSSQGDDEDTSLDIRSEASTTVVNSSNCDIDHGLLTQDFSNFASRKPPQSRRSEVVNRSCVVTPPSIGSRDRPIEVDDDDVIESRASDFQNCSTPPPRASRFMSNRKADYFPSKIMCKHFPSKCDSNRERNTQEGRRIAKCFEGDDSTASVYFGTVLGKYEDSEKWLVQYDSHIEDEDFGKRELKEAFQFYTTHQSSDTSLGAHTNKSTHSCNLELPSIVRNIPMVSPDDESKVGNCLVQTNLKRRIHYAGPYDTPSRIAKRRRVDVNDIISINKVRKDYENIQRSSLFSINSPIVLPLDASTDN